MISESQPRIAPVDRQEVVDMERVRVVIADDESVICMDLREMLSNVG